MKIIFHELGFLGHDTELPLGQSVVKVFPLIHSLKRPSMIQDASNFLTQPLQMTAMHRFSSGHSLSVAVSKRE